jgi:glycosyltransferase 2 family protein
LSPRTRSALVNTGGIALAALLLYLALRGVDLDAMIAALRGADYRWVAPVAAVLLGSHVLRAIRWCALLEVLDSQPVRRRIGPAFAAIMVGYMVNYAAPRLGEVVRTASYARHSGLPISGVLGTVVAERVLDVLMLALGLVSVAIILSDQLTGLLDALLQADDLTTYAVLAVAGGLAVVLGVALLLLFRRFLRSSGSERVTSLKDRVRPVLESFKDGVMAALRAPRRGTIIVTTLAIWMCYGLAAFIPFAMLGMHETYSIGLPESWVMMIVGSLGILVPSPGGIGSFHYVTIQGLTHLYGVSAQAAASYAILTHAAQFVLYLGVGLICLLTFRRISQTKVGSGV